MSKRVYILGTGESLNRFDVDFFKDKTTIGVNASIEKYFDVLNYYIVIDTNSHKKWIDKARQLGKERFYCYSRIAEKYNITEEEATIFERANGEHFVLKKYNPLKLATGFTVVFCAVNLALLLGFNEIVLCGCDFCYYKFKAHYNDNVYFNKFENNLTLLKVKTDRQIATRDGNVYPASEFHHKMRSYLIKAVERLKRIKSEVKFYNESASKLYNFKEA